MLEQIDESIDISINLKSLQQSNRNPEPKISLLKLPKTKTTSKLITIFWYNQFEDKTYEFSSNFNETLTLGDISNWLTIKWKETNLPQIDAQSTQFYLPKKKFGKPNEDFPSFRNELSLKDCNQCTFALKVKFITRNSIPSKKKEFQISYNNSLQKEQRFEITVSKKKKQNNQLFCFCYSGE
ncbi:unnamed protein product [Paramecium sonneborni]|uniref:Uncharacterized protein n=1 Tax=Paramecium sonneborni TaxID=65129 RepID=A0A8S1QHG5_9CILI|nr:unnamed protein product [Paramecium sonneborni]